LVVWAGVAPASFLRQSLIYPIFIGDASFNQLLKLRFRTKQDKNRPRSQLYADLDRRSQGEQQAKVAYGLSGNGAFQNEIKQNFID
jgi:hypothetical protein